MAASLLSSWFFFLFFFRFDLSRAKLGDRVGGSPVRTGENRSRALNTLLFRAPRRFLGRRSQGRINTRPERRPMRNRVTRIVYHSMPRQRGTRKVTIDLKKEKKRENKTRIHSAKTDFRDNFSRVNESCKSRVTSRRRKQ